MFKVIKNKYKDWVLQMEHKRYDQGYKRAADLLKGSKNPKSMADAIQSIDMELGFHDGDQAYHQGMQNALRDNPANGV